MDESSNSTINIHGNVGKFTQIENVNGDVNIQHPLTVFLPAMDVFQSEISRNFLYEYNGPDSDYAELLSEDLRKLFFSFFNRHLLSRKTNHLVIEGQEGSGKTFNTLLIANRLSQEGYCVKYCQDIRYKDLTRQSISDLENSADDKTIFIIDNCHTDTEKTGDLVSWIGKDNSSSKSKYIFLTRPLEDKETFIDIFGSNTPVIIMKEEFVNLEHLVKLFFGKLNRQNSIDEFMESIRKGNLSSAFFEYRNMAFWNETLKAIQINDNLTFGENEIYKRGYQYFKKHESELLKYPDIIAPLLAFFSRGISIHREYISRTLKLPVEPLRDLESLGIISQSAQDWVAKDYTNDSAIFYISGMHPTKARILLRLLEKYYGQHIDVCNNIIPYLENYPENLYYILSPIYDPNDLRAFYKDDRLLSVTKEYLKHRPLGKKLDRFINRLTLLEPQVQDFLFDSEVLENIAQKINDPRLKLVSKLLAFRSVYRIAPEKAYELFQLLTPDSLIRSFLDNPEGTGVTSPEGTGVTSFSKWMELFKNIYYFADNEEKRQEVRQFVIVVLDACSEEYIKRFEARDTYFTQLHWLLKRLNGMRLANYFLEKIPPDKLVELVRSKDINTVELCKAFLFAARYAQLNDQDGMQLTYYDVFRSTLNYADIKRIFDNRRSDLYDIIINATHDFVAKFLVKYIAEPKFREKVLRESDYLREASISLIKRNIYLSQEERLCVVRAIVQAQNTPLESTRSGHP